MPLKNRVDPFGLLHKVPERGLFMGNRGGCFHRADKSLLPTPWRNQRWIICVLEFKSRRRELMAPGKYTELFFLDEATAMSAGHRPCFECRRTKALEFQAAFEIGNQKEVRSVKDIDAYTAGWVQGRLSNRNTPKTQSLLETPDGSLFRSDGRDFLIWEGKAWLWSFGGYKISVELPEKGLVLTPPATQNAFRAGYVPRLHPSVYSS